MKKDKRGFFRLSQELYDKIKKKLEDTCESDSMSSLIRKLLIKWVKE